MNPTRLLQLVCCFVLICVLVVGGAGCKKDEETTNPVVIVPITDNLFPLTVGNKFTYGGYATIAGSGDTMPDPLSVYKTVWTIATNVAPSPLGGTATAIVDSTTLPVGPGGAGVTFARNLLIKKDSVKNDYYFMQTIGPFKRVFGITVGTAPSDTLIWVAVARGSQGVGSTGAQWTAYDSTFTGTGGSSVRLQIFGKIETQETITDSSSAHTQYLTYRSRTWRRITISGSVVQDDYTTSKLWLAKDIGPVQVRIVEDTENIGHFRVMRSRNF